MSSLLVPSLMDSIDYGEWLVGKRNDALVMSANSFGNKLKGPLQNEPPARGAWIEISSDIGLSGAGGVAPRTGGVD